MTTTRTKPERAAALIRSQLADGPRPAGEVKAAGFAEGISPRTMERAAVNLGVVTDREPGGLGWSYTWRLERPVDGEEVFTDWTPALKPPRACVYCTLPAWTMVPRTRTPAHFRCHDGAKARKLPECPTCGRFAAVCCEQSTGGSAA